MYELNAFGLLDSVAGEICASFLALSCWHDWCWAGRDSHLTHPAARHVASVSPAEVLTQVGGPRKRHDEVREAPSSLIPRELGHETGAIRNDWRTENKWVRRHARGAFRDGFRGALGGAFRG
jgi:hypothetical protein